MFVVASRVLGIIEIESVDTVDVSSGQRAVLSDVLSQLMRDASDELVGDTLSAFPSACFGGRVRSEPQLNRRRQTTWNLNDVVYAEVDTLAAELACEVQSFQRRLELARAR